MNDYEYELIGESVWDTYQSMAYILMGEGSGGAKSQRRKELARLRKSHQLSRKELANLGTKGAKKVDVGAQKKRDLIRSGESNVRQRMRGEVRAAGERVRYPQEHLKDVATTREIATAHRRFFGGQVERDELAQRKPGEFAARAAERKAKAARRTVQRQPGTPRYSKGTEGQIGPGPKTEH